VTIKLYQFI